MTGQRVEISFDQKSVRLLERIAKALEKQNRDTTSLFSYDSSEPIVTLDSSGIPIEEGDNNDEDRNE